MKRIILLTFVVLISLQIKAQTYTEEIDRIYQLLDKSPITSNILIDRSFPVAGIQMFNQGIRKDTSNFAHFKQAWNELSKASYIQNFITIEQVEQQLKNKNYTNNIVPIGMINTEFHQGNFGKTIDSATVNLNSATGLLTNKVGRNPFIKKQTTIIAPLVNRATGRSIIFKTDSLFRLHKLGKRIKTLQLFTNNTSFILISNYNLTTSSFTTSYTSSGILKIEVKVTNECGCHTETNVYKVGTSSSPSYRSKTKANTLIKSNFNLSLFPNPAHNSVTIIVPNNSSEPLDYTITLTNINTNTVVYSNTFITTSQKKHIILPTSYPQGIYIATISSKYGKTTKKLIIK